MFTKEQLERAAQLGIKEADLLIINGRFRSKQSRSIVKDWLTDEYIDCDYDRYMSFSVAEDFRNDNIVYNTKYTKKYDSNNLINATFQYNLRSPHSVNTFTFENKEKLDDFIKRFGYVKGKINRDRYYHNTLLQYDRKRPVYWNSFKPKRKVTDLLGSHMFDRKANCNEYKDLQNHVFSLNEKYGTDSRTYLAFEGIPHTFGIELETVSGSIQADVINKYNMSSIFDGSLRDLDKDGVPVGDPWGAEYVTGVLKGDAGLKHVHEITKLLSKECTVDKRAAFHVHIGSLKWNSENIVFAYLLGKMLEDEIFSLMPKSRSNNDYCRVIPNVNIRPLNQLLNFKTKDDYKKSIKSLYANIFNIVSQAGAPSKQWNKKSRHPRGQHGGYDRGVDHRYSWLNFTNIIFNQRGSEDSKTIEFRCHSGTLCYNKIHNWIKICMGIVEYVNTNKSNIIKALKTGNKITLSTIMATVYPKSHNKLNNYIQIRKNLFSGTDNENIDYSNDELNIKTLKDIICV